MNVHGVPGGGSRWISLLALRGLSVFPSMVVSLQVGRPQSLSAVQDAMNGDGILMLAAQKDLRVEQPDPDDLFPMGTLVRIQQAVAEENGHLRLVVEGLARARIVQFVQVAPHFRVLVEPIAEPAPGDSREIEALVRSVMDRYERFVRLARRLRPENAQAMPAMAAVSPEQPGRLADQIAANLPVKLEDRQAVLDAVPLKERLEKLSRILHRETELLELERKIQLRVRKQVEKTHREYYLREQLKAIQKELGEEEEKGSETAELRARIKACGMPAEVEEKALKEVDRLEKMPPAAAEAAVVRNYVDWLASLPWSSKTEDHLDIAEARRVLDEDHYALEPIKERILEFLAVRQLTLGTKGPILCLVGPPGVGKTSLARSIARALGRKFVRVSLGGVRDEAEVRGHRRTYVGAMPGRIIQGMRQAGSRNPVFLLDEIDKMSADFRGDPSAALLEVLDPEQNSAFSDHYIEVAYDLSEVMFITTANTVYPIPRPLLDRMEVIVIPGYTEEEKVRIARDHLLTRVMEAHGLQPGDLAVSDEALRALVRRYTREAGVRNLERELAAICRKVARQVAEAAAGTAADGAAASAAKRLPRRVTARNLHEFLGPERFRYGTAEAESQVGVATGVGWTEYGGDVMAIEVSVLPGKGGLFLTGKLGEVMRESAQAGFSFIRSRAAALGVDPRFHENVDLHIHIPEGAVPKDGPSAGITMAAALASALTGVPVRRDVAMTGEITLRGRVLPVGGVKEKVLAAHRAGITTMILPAENRKDLRDIPANVRRRMTFVFVEDMDRVLQVALASPPAAVPAGAPASGASDGGTPGAAVAGGTSPAGGAAAAGGASGREGGRAVKPMRRVAVSGRSGKRARRAARKGERKSPGETSREAS